MGLRTIHQYPRLLMTKRARWFSQNSHKHKNAIVDPEVVLPPCTGGHKTELQAPGSWRRDPPWTCKTASIYISIYNSIYNNSILQFHLQQYLQQFNLASILFAAPELRLLTLAARPGYPGCTSRRWSWLRVWEAIRQTRAYKMPRKPRKSKATIIYWHGCFYIG